MREPQARLAAALAPADPDAAQHGSTDPLDELLAQRRHACVRARHRAAGRAGFRRCAGPGPAQALPAGARQAPLPHDTADLLGDRPDARWTPARAELATASSDSQAQTLATVHPAAVPLVRQQLDALATDQFRWAGEAWPGARLDWTIGRRSGQPCATRRRRHG